ncbi:MAG: hypothetical protein AAGE52_01155 [Myxococcota bacterium]
MPRPSALTRRKLEEIRFHVEGGLGYHAACVKAGVTDRTATNWRTKGRKIRERGGGGIFVDLANLADAAIKAKEGP